MLAVNVKNLDLEMAALVAQKVVLKEIYLVDAKISRDPVTVSPETLSLKHKCSTEILDFDNDKKILCHFQVAAFGGEAPDKLVMKIEASFCTSYVMKPLPDLAIPDDDGSFLADFMEYYLTINPISNSWPYWREFVQSMSARMGFPALTVPFLEISPKKSAPKRGKSQSAKKVSPRRKKLRA